MKQHVLSFAIASVILATGCDMPGRPALRIGISSSPGSAIVYLAKEAGLFEMYKVDVEIVELTCGHECRTAFVNRQLDAVVMPYSELEQAMHANTSEAGLLMLLAAPKEKTLFQELQSCDHSWRQGDVEILAGSRGDLMQRRQEWQRVLLAYEHARLLLSSGQPNHIALVADREHWEPDAVSAELEHWQVFGIMQQDSLLSKEGPYGELQARWQGQVHFSASVSSKAAKLLHEKQANQPGDKVR